MAKKFRVSPNQLHGYFNQKGHRLTVPRKAIIGVLSKSGGHITAEQIYFNVHKKYPVVGLTTVYRTLDLLTNWGFLHKLDFGEKKSRFKLISDSDNVGHSHHLVCVNCKKIINYTDFLNEEKEMFTKLHSLLAEKFNFKILNHSVQFQGICKACSKKS